MSDNKEDNTLPEDEITTGNVSDLNLPENDEEAGIIPEPVADFNSDEPANPEIEKVTEPPLTKTNFVIKDSPISSLDGKFTFQNLFLTGPANNAQAVAETISNAPQLDGESSDVDRRWTAVLTQGQYTTPAFSQYTKPLQDPGIIWKQGLDSPAGVLKAGIPQYSDVKGDTVSGVRAVMRVRSQIGYGTYLNIPCFHSGFWITLKAPLRHEIDELFRHIEATKVNVCNNSYGLALSNSTSYMLRPIFELIRNCLHDTSVKGADFDWFATKFSSLDIPWVVAHLAQLVWRKGFQYAHACINDVQSCANVITEKIEIGKCMLVANQRFTDLQKAHMTKRVGSSMSFDEIEKYRNDFVWSYGKLVELQGDNGSVSFFLKDPSVDDYISAGVRWVDRLETSISKTISATADMAERNAMLNKAADVTEMMEYAHWVNYIDLGNGQRIVDRETIDTILMDLSGERSLVQNFNVAVKEFIDEASVSIVAAPTTKCPVCQAEDIEAGDTFKGVVAIDALNAFFILLSQEITGQLRMKIYR